MDSRDFTCPSCDHRIAIKVLGGKQTGVFVLTCESCKARLTVDLSEKEPSLVEPPQTKRSRSAYSRLPPEMAQREQMMKKAFEEAWGSPPPGHHLYDDLHPPPGKDDQGHTGTGAEPREPAPGDRYTQGDPSISQGRQEGPPRYDGYPSKMEAREGWYEGAPPTHDRPTAPPSSSRWTAMFHAPPGQGPPSNRVLLAALALLLAGLLGLTNVYILMSMDWADTGEKTDVTIILKDEGGARLNATELDERFAKVNLTLGDDYRSFDPDSNSRYVFEKVETGRYDLLVSVPGYESQKREVIVSTSGSVSFGDNNRYTGDRFVFELEEGTGQAETEENPMDMAVYICSPFFLLMSLLAILGAYLTHRRTSYTGALAGGVGGILALGFMGIGSLLAFLALYLIYTNKYEFPGQRPRVPPWMQERDQPMGPSEERGPAGPHYSRYGNGEHETEGYHPRPPASYDETTTGTYDAHAPPETPLDEPQETTEEYHDLSKSQEEEPDELEEPRD